MLYLAGLIVVGLGAAVVAAEAGARFIHRRRAKAPRLLGTQEYYATFKRQKEDK